MNWLVYILAAFIAGMQVQYCITQLRTPGIGRHRIKQPNTGTTETISLFQERLYPPEMVEEVEETFEEYWKAESCVAENIAADTLGFPEDPFQTLSEITLGQPVTTVYDTYLLTYWKGGVFQWPETGNGT